MANDVEAKLGGGSLSQRVQQGEKLRPPEREDAAHSERLLNGEAWRDFCRLLEKAGQTLLREDLARSTFDRA